MLGSIWKRLDDLFECLIESLDKSEGLVEDAIGQLSVVRSDLIDTDCQSSLASVEHVKDLGAVAGAVSVRPLQAVIAPVPSCAIILCSIVSPAFDLFTLQTYVQGPETLPQVSCACPCPHL